MSTVADVEECMREACAEINRLRAVNEALLAALEAVSVKTDNGLQNGGKWAVQTLDAIDELVRAAIAEARKDGRP